MMLFLYVLIAIAGIVIIPTLVFTFIDIILDAGINPFIHLEFLHTLIVFPIMLGFIHLRFDIQKRDKMYFYLFAFTDYEEKIIKKMGYRFEEDIDFYEVQNVFGAKRESVSCTTTVYNKVKEE
ncbi:MAG: hypothetical protein J6T10_11940 [Methanobrevibacter sp.]|nr:hypothetical protein [Methanobrevibacter sp.]